MFKIVHKGCLDNFHTTNLFYNARLLKERESQFSQATPTSVSLYTLIHTDSRHLLLPWVKWVDESLVPGEHGDYLPTRKICKILSKTCNDWN